MYRLFFAMALLVSLFAVDLQAQEPTRIIINQPANPSGAGWVPITRLWNRAGGTFHIGNINPTTGLREFFAVGGAEHQIWLTDENGMGSLHTFDTTGAYDYIEVYVQGPVLNYISYRPFIYYKWKNGVCTTSAVTYLSHTIVPFPLP